MGGEYYPSVEIDIQPILEKLTTIADNQIQLIGNNSESAKAFDENQKLMLEDFETIKENQSVLIVGYDLINQRLKNQNIGTTDMC